MRPQPIWGVSAWGGFVCVLLAISSFMQGQPAAGAVMGLGAIGLSVWAAWLARSRP